MSPAQSCPSQLFVDQEGQQTKMALTVYHGGCVRRAGGSVAAIASLPQLRGSAGCVVADRLSEDGAQVVLLEAGPLA